jgi:hypothetical protein
MLDDEVYNSETAKFSRIIGSLLHVLQVNPIFGAFQGLGRGFMG